jgi:hypothetical protein
MVSGRPPRPVVLLVVTAASLSTLLVTGTTAASYAATVPTSSTAATLATTGTGTPGPVAGDTKTVPYSATLSTSGQSLGGPGPLPAKTDVHHTWFDQSFSGSVGFDEVWESPSIDPCEYIPLVPSCSFSFGDYGAAFNASARGEIGMGDTLHGFQPGTVSVDYPVATQVTAPADGSFASGDTVAIHTTAPTVQSGAAITTTAPSLDSFSIEGKLGFHVSADGKVCVVSCWGGNIFSLDLPGSGETYDGSVLTLSADDLVMTQGMGLGRCFGAAEAAIFGAGTYPNDKDYCKDAYGANTGYVKLPSATIGADGGATTVSGTTLSGRGTDQFVVVPISAMSWLGKLVDLPTGFPNLSKSFDGGSVSYTTLDAVIAAVMTQTRDVSFSPSVQTTFDLGRSASYTVVDTAGNVVQRGTGSSVTFPLGQTLKVEVEGPMTVTPTLAMRDSTFSHHAWDDIAGSVRVKALSMHVNIGGCDCLGLFDGISADVGPVYDHTWDIGRGAIATEADSVWQLGGFDRPTLAPFTLSPVPLPVATYTQVDPVADVPLTDAVVAGFTDPDPAHADTPVAGLYGAVVAWGDGSTSTGTVQGTGRAITVRGDHLYADAGSYTVTVTLASKTVRSVAAVGRSRAVVSSPPLVYVAPFPSLHSVAGEPTEDGVRVASFGDPVPATVDRYAARVDWGDGTSDPARVVLAQPGVYDVLAPSHTYANDGTPQVVVHVATRGGGDWTSTPSMVTDPAPVASSPVTTPTAPTTPACTTCIRPTHVTTVVKSKAKPHHHRRHVRRHHHR